MNATAKLFLTIGSFSGALSVILGAFGAHGLKEKLSEKMLANWMTGVEYQFYHTLALLLLGLLALHLPARAIGGAGWAFTIGITLFSGSLYVMALTGITKLGMITPIGGLAFIVGWVLLAVSVIKS
ncbi:MAG: DUF423 domain-containing protein [Pontiellaceae bacterium]|nr:DUF423 domain-containing protein [Pontiellaceae bacterium]